MDAFGSVTWWGFSEALDLQNKDLNTVLKGCKIEESQKDTSNILLIGSGDIRHIFKTICQSWRHPKKKLNFFVIENNLEIYARDMLFLSILLDSPNLMGFQEKTELFLELFGNTLVRAQSMEYLETKCSDFIKMVTDFDFLEKMLPIVDMSQLKFKERDMLEAIFKFWKNKSKDAFDIEKCWDLRLRKHLGVRYDAIPNVFDWDLSMKLHNKGAEIISSHEYLKWRQTGIAFEIREGTYNVPNRTLASGMVFKHDGEKFARRGYWGDILVSPYISFGIESEEQSFFKKTNNLYTKLSCDVAEYNILALLHELTNKDKYERSIPKQKEGATITEIIEEEEEEDFETDAVHDSKGDQTQSQIQVDNVKIYFLPIGSATEIHKKSKYHNLFDVVYFSNSMVHTLNNDIRSTFAEKAEIILETAKFMLELKEEQTKQFVEKVTAMAKGASCKVIEPCDPLKDSFARFIYLPES